MFGEKIESSLVEALPSSAAKQTLFLIDDQVQVPVSPSSSSARRWSLRWSKLSLPSSSAKNSLFLIYDHDQFPGSPSSSSVRRWSLRWSKFCHPAPLRRLSS
jgi:hypothetical protein